VEAPRETAEQIVTRLEQADQPVPQVVLEAIVCVITPECGLQCGLDWSHAVTIEGFDALNVGLGGLALNGRVSRRGADNAFSDFAVTSAFIRLLAQEGYLTIRAAPRVMARDGEKAEISIARETFFSVQPLDSEFLFRQDIEKVEAGITLIMTPSIRGDNVSVQIERAEVSEDIRTADRNRDLEYNPYPLINRRRVTTSVDVKDGQTIVIGGLVQRQTVERISEVPWLSDLPGLGHLFRTVEAQERDAEVVIFISPRIVAPGHASPPPEPVDGEVVVHP
jgi:type II secretory pathway component GspD/PulD (secretin)